MAEYYFNLPQITSLTLPQQAALNETKPIALSGGPGTGKSVVSLWRHILNYQQNKKSLLLTYTTTLKEYLKACCRTQNSDAADNVATSLSSRWVIKNRRFNEIIIDEAQDLSFDFYNGILSDVSYGADDSQILYLEHCSTQEQLKELFPNNVDCVLSKNFRSTQSIMKFAKSVFVNAVISREIIDGLANNIGELPVFMITRGGKFDATNNQQDSAIIEIINNFRSDTHNIAILVPWKKDVCVFEQMLNNKGFHEFSLYYEDNNRFPGGCCSNIKNVHITTFKSAKGLEFDTVIIPNFNKYNEICGRFNIDWQDFYVACTRAKSNLYLISNCDMSCVSSSVVEKVRL